MLIWMIDDHPNKTKEELIEIINKRWNRISINSIKKFIQNNQKEIEKNKEIALNDEEKTYVKKWCDVHHADINWDKTRTYIDVDFVWFVTYFHFTHYPAETYLKLVGSGIQNHGIQTNILEFVLEYKPELSAQLSKRIIENLNEEKAKGYELHLHFDFIKEHQITEAICELCPYIEKNDAYSYQALKTYISLDGGDGYLLDLFRSIIPSPEDYREQTLLDHFSAHRNEAFEKILLQKLAATSDSEQQLIYARYLLRQQNVVGLQFLADYIEREKKSPFSAHIGNPDYLFENPMGIPTLLRLFDYGNDPLIPNTIYDSISGVGRNMLIHMAACQDNRYFENIRAAIIEYLNTQTSLNEVTEHLNPYLRLARPEALIALRYILKTLEFNHYQKQPVTIKEAEDAWEKLNNS